MRESVARVERVETVPLLHPFDDTEKPPIWRVVVGGYCADFDHEQAACNFCAAINNAILAKLTPSEMTERQRDHFAAAMAYTDGERETVPATPAAGDGALRESELTVPREPTDEMMQAGLYASSHDSDWGSVNQVWKAMFDSIALDGGCTTLLPVAPSPSDGALREVDGNDIWEALFSIMKGNVPDEMTESVCAKLAARLALGAGDAS
jgi:hypothetical protein